MIDIDNIKKLIHEKQELVMAKASEPHDYNSLKQRVLQLELKQEIAFLLECLNEPELFSKAFKQRCAQRADGIEDAIGFDKMPLSETNHLYWQIAEQIFAPKTLAGMLAIVAPAVQKHLKVKLSEEFSMPMKQAVNQGIAPILDLKENVSDLKEQPQLSHLSNYVIHGAIIFDVRDMENFPLRSHAKLHTQLNSIHPALCLKLYEHNYTLRTLKEGIETFNQQGKSPLDALRALIKGLTLGGQRMSGSEYASNLAVEAIHQFSAFMESLPSEVQDNLKKAQGHGGSLGNVIDNELHKGSCVETAALHLQAIVEANQKNPLFNQPAKMTRENLKELEKKHKQVSAEQDDSRPIILPEKLMLNAIQGIAPKNTSELIGLIMNFPPGLYGALLANINLTNPYDALTAIADIIKQTWLTKEQTDALAGAVIRYYKQLNPNGNLLCWAVETNNGLYIQNALETFPEKDRLAAVQVKDKFGDTVLYYAASYPESLKAILALYPNEQDQLAAVKDEFGDMILHYAARHPDSLKIILALIPKQERLAAAQVKDESGNRVLHKAASHPESLKTILALYPKKDWLAAIKGKGFKGRTVLHKAASHPESLKIILALYPKKDRLAAIQGKDFKGKTVLHKAASHPESLKVILAHFPEKGRLAAVQAKDKHGYTVLHDAAIYPQSPKTILALIPEKDHLAAVKILAPISKTAYPYLSLTDQVRFSYWAGKNVISKLLSDDSNITSYEMVFDNFAHNISPKEALLEVLKVYQVVRREDSIERFYNQPFIFFGSAYSKQQEITKIQAIIWGSSYNASSLNVLRQGEPKHIITAWEQKYNVRLDEVFLESAQLNNL